MRGVRGAVVVMALALGSSIPARAADVTGKWQAEFDTQIGVQKYTYTLQAKGEQLTGKASFERAGTTGEVELKEGKVKGDDISFVEMLTFQDQEIRIEYKGKLAGDELKLTRQVGNYATEDFIAKRVKE